MNRRPLIALFVAETISVLGSRMTMVALPWLVLVTTGSAARAGSPAGSAFGTRTMYAIVPPLRK